MKSKIIAVSVFLIALVTVLTVVFMPKSIQGSEVSVEEFTISSEVISQDFTLRGGVRSTTTESAFSIELLQEEDVIPYETVYEYTDELVLDEQQVTQPGVAGKVLGERYIFRWGDVNYYEEYAETGRVDPVSEIVKVGTRKEYKQMQVPEGELSYYQKIHMWATSYDGNCYGCTGRTYTGTSVKHGVCAVDPNVIPLGSNMYIPGYGYCRAEDIGGGIKGNKIDLGFENIQWGWWSARYTDVYLLE